MKDKALCALYDTYAARMRDMRDMSFSLHEIDGRNAADINQKLSEKIKDNAYVIALDERGKSLKSTDFSAKIQDLAADTRQPVQFVIGGADGLDENLKKRADFLLSFGVQTWPHMLVRIMLVEQLYRARQINAGHPYHRE